MIHSPILHYTVLEADHRGRKLSELAMELPDVDAARRGVGSWSDFVMELPEVDATRLAIAESCAEKRVTRAVVADDPKVIDGVSCSDFKAALVVDSPKE